MEFIEGMYLVIHIQDMGTPYVSGYADFGVHGIHFHI